MLLKDEGDSAIPGASRLDEGQMYGQPQTFGRLGPEPLLKGGNRRPQGMDVPDEGYHPTVNSR